MLAAVYGHFDTVKVLLDAGASIFVFSNTGHRNELVNQIIVISQSIYS